jgi:type II secretory pathway component HofQ
VPGTSGHRRSRSTRRIDLELQDADIYDVLDLFAEIGKVSIVAERGIPHKKVTARLTGVPWDEALVAILRSVGLGMLRDGSVIYVVSADR